LPVGRATELHRLRSRKQAEAKSAPGQFDRRRPRAHIMSATQTTPGPTPISHRNIVLGW